MHSKAVQYGTAEMPSPKAKGCRGPASRGAKGGADAFYATARSAAPRRTTLTRPSSCCRVDSGDSYGESRAWATRHAESYKNRWTYSHAATSPPPAYGPETPSGTSRSRTASAARSRYPFLRRPVFCRPMVCHAGARHSAARRCAACHRLVARCVGCGSGRQTYWTAA